MTDHYREEAVLRASMEVVQTPHLSFIPQNK